MSERISQARPRPAAERPSIKHCYVTDVNGRLPALLVEWRQTEANWQGRVVRPVLEDDRWVVVGEWLPAGLLDPA